MYWQASETKDHKKIKEIKEKALYKKERRDKRKREQLSNKNKFDFLCFLILTSHQAEGACIDASMASVII